MFLFREQKRRKKSASSRKPSRRNSRRGQNLLVVLRTCCNPDVWKGDDDMVRYGQGWLIWLIFTSDEPRAVIHSHIQLRGNWLHSIHLVCFFLSIFRALFSFRTGISRVCGETKVIGRVQRKQETKELFKSFMHTKESTGVCKKSSRLPGQLHLFSHPLLVAFSANQNVECFVKESDKAISFSLSV